MLEQLKQQVYEAKQNPLLMKNNQLQPIYSQRIPFCTQYQNQKIQLWRIIGSDK